MTQKYILVSTEEWRLALASQAATERFLDRLMERLDQAASTEGWVGPKMPWHNWLESSEGG